MAESQHSGCCQKTAQTQLWNAVDGIMMRAVKRGLAQIKQPLSATSSLCVDEVALKKDTSTSPLTREIVEKIIVLIDRYSDIDRYHRSMYCS